MRSQPNLASRLEVVSIYKYPQQILGAPTPNFGRNNIKFWTTYSATSALDTAYLRNETSHRQTKTPLSIHVVFPNRSPTFRDI